MVSEIWQLTQYPLGATPVQKYIGAVTSFYLSVGSDVLPGTGAGVPVQAVVTGSKGGPQVINVPYGSYRTRRVTGDLITVTGNGAQIELIADKEKTDVVLQNVSTFFGSGQDGPATLDGVTSYSWATLVGATYTMTRSIQVTNLTINSGVYLHTGNFQIYCQGSFVNNGSVIAAGSGNYGGGSGGSGASGAAGGPGTAGAVTSYGVYPGGGGGGGGGATGGFTGGAGGAGGGVFWISTVDFVNNGQISANGQNGGSGTGGGSSGGGGGGGGGAAVIFYLRTLSGTANISVSGGSGGSGVGAALPGPYSGGNGGSSAQAAGGTGSANTPTAGGASSPWGGGGGGGGGVNVSDASSNGAAGGNGIVITEQVNSST
jgi:hypothetical protein